MLGRMDNGGLELEDTEDVVAVVVVVVVVGAPIHDTHPIVSLLLLLLGCVFPMTLWNVPTNQHTPKRIPTHCRQH